MGVCYASGFGCPCCASFSGSTNGTGVAMQKAAIVLFASGEVMVICGCVNGCSTKNEPSSATGLVR